MKLQNMSTLYNYLNLSLTFQCQNTRPEEILRREGFTYVVARANDYTRMFSTPARRAAPAHPESPRHDKKPRPASLAPDLPDHVQLRERAQDDGPERNDRLSASDFYTVTEDVTPQPFKGNISNLILDCHHKQLVADHYRTYHFKEQILP